MRERTGPMSAIATVAERVRAACAGPHPRWRRKETISWTGPGIEVVVSFGPRRYQLTQEIMPGQIEVAATITLIAASAPFAILSADAASLPIDLDEVVTVLGLTYASHEYEAIDHHYLVNVTGTREMTPLAA